MDSAADAACYTAGSVVGAVFGTLLTVLVLAGLAFLFWRFYWRRRRGKHLSLETGDREAVVAATHGPLGDRFAFDNPCFLSEDSSPNRKNKKGAPKIKADGTPTGKVEKNAKSEKGVGGGRLGKWTSWSPIGALVGTGGTNSKHNEKRRAFDDSFMGEPERVSVSLRGHDFTGLGFNVCGNMRDGIFVRDVLHRGPASESGQIAAGDRIVSLGISFEHMVFEDALTILSYASPYEVLLQVEKGASPPGSTLLAGADISSGQTSLKRTTASTVPSGLGSGHSPDKQRAIICHPFYRSQSIDDLDKIGKASINAKRAQQIAEMTRIKSRMQEDDAKSSPASEVDGRGLGKGATVEEEKLQRRDANPSMPTEEEVRSEGGGHHAPFPKFGVRVLPPSVGNPNTDKSLGMGKAHNPGGYQNNPGREGKQEETSITIATPEPQKQNERNSMIEMGAGKEERGGDGSHDPTEGMSVEVAVNNPSRNMGDKEVEQVSPPTSRGSEAEGAVGERRANPREAKDADEGEGDEEKMAEVEQSSEEGMIGEVPEEVRMAAMAAVTNRKSIAMGTAHAARGLDDGTSAELKWRGRSRTTSGGSSCSSEDGERALDGGPGNGGKRRAPAPPADQSENEEEMRAATPPCEMEEQGEERRKKGGTRIELGMDHVTVHHQPMELHVDFEAKAISPGTDSKDSQMGELMIAAQEESDMEVEEAPEKAKRAAPGGKAASLGDLSRLEGGEVLRPPRMRAGPSFVTGGAESGVVLERAVSLDLGNAEEVVVGPPSATAVGSAKKRKAPAPPTPASRGDSAGTDEVDGSLRVDAKSDSGDYGKEPRLAGVGTTDTFGRRLKKSSDWGTMEEALLAGGSPSSSSSASAAGRTILHLGSTPSFQLSSTVTPSVSDAFSPECGIGATSSEVSTTRAEEETREESEVSIPSQVNSAISEISLQSSVITSSDTDAEVNATVSSTTEMLHKVEEAANSSAGLDANRVIVTTSTSIEEVVDSTTFPSQQGGRASARSDVVHLEVTDDPSSNYLGEGAKVTSGDSFQSSFQRAREFFEREEEGLSHTPDDDDDDDVTSSPPSLPTSPMPTLQSGSPLSLHSTTTYISSIEDIPVVPGSLLERSEFGMAMHSMPSVQHHITEIQVRSIGEDGKTVETRELVMGQNNNQPFGRIGEVNNDNVDRNLPGSSDVKLSVSPVKIPMSEGEILSNTYMSESFPMTDNVRAILQSGPSLTGQSANMSDAHFQAREVSHKLIDNHNLEPPTYITATLGSTSQLTDGTGGRIESISSSENMGESGNSTVQIRMREGPSGWVPQRQRNNRAEETGDERIEISDGSRSEGVKVAKKKPPVPPRKDASNTSASESPSKSDAGSPYTSNVKTIVEVPVSFTKRLVQVHETRGDEGGEGMEVRHGVPLHRVSEREVIQITPQELDKVMMSHSQFLSHKRGDSPSKLEQWLPAAPSTRTVVHRIVEQWVADEDGKSKILPEASLVETMGSSAEVMPLESGAATPPNGIVSSVTESTVIESTPDSRRQNMSVTRIMVDPEFGSNMGRGSDSVAKTMMVANLQLSGMEGKTTASTSGLHT